MTTTTTKTATDLEQFYTELLKDPVLQERLKAATDPESLSELALELGRQKGYFFTKEEVLAAMAIEAAMGGEYEEIPLTGGTHEMRGSGGTDCAYSVCANSDYCPVPESCLYG